MNVHSSWVNVATPEVVPRGKSKQEAILTAAVELFVERGFHGTAVPAVAKRAGVSTGTIYNYFDSKEALVNVLFRMHKQAISLHVYSHFPATAEPREQFHAIWTYMVDFATTHPAAFAFLELHHHGSYLDDESRAMEHQLREFGAGFIDQAKALGVLKPMPTLLTMELVFGAFVGMMRARWEGRIELTPESLREAEQACWDLISMP
jgi:AcrR family transcriptional regulator